MFFQRALRDDQRRGAAVTNLTGIACSHHAAFRDRIEAGEPLH